ncbi:hypothetical protein SLNWT_0125 [Streptomyces albus]|uniref:Uncharacterized protein n=1 Tax=Streptomyces albus (strain ATCC 21838 / DSM 41398 / FERM P-419 / JCM 4703 / NBRC 107858) TaxID=1081613 RepID=A0A0B5ENV8_STRA4|nr:hypothetical protein SLNWT_0125 [Streptomyces albus]
MRIRPEYITLFGLVGRRRDPVGPDLEAAADISHVEPGDVGGAREGTLPFRCEGELFEGLLFGGGGLSVAAQVVESDLVVSGARFHSQPTAAEREVVARGHVAVRVDAR